MLFIFFEVNKLFINHTHTDPLNDGDNHNKIPHPFRQPNEKKK